MKERANQQVSSRYHDVGAGDVPFEDAVAGDVVGCGIGTREMMVAVLRGKGDGGEGCW